MTYKLITAMAIPDHATIAEFRRRHERALGELFTAVLALCCEAGLVEVGVISVDGVKIRANASWGANRTYEKLVADILKEAEETDRWEDGLFGEDRGDEPPEHLRTGEGRRAAFRAAKERLAQKAGGGEEPEVARIEVDPDRVAAGRGRRAWQRTAHKELMGRRERHAKPIARSRAERLLETLHRLEENRQVEIAANTAYETWWAQRRAGGVPGQKLGMPPKPVTPPPVPEGVMNKTDHDSRMMRTQGQPTVQGYNAQAAVIRAQIIVAAEIAVESPDFGHLEPAVRAALRELADAGVTQRPETVLADAGYWHTTQMQSIVSDGIQVLVPPDAGLREGARPGWEQGPYAFVRRVLASDAGHELYKHRKATVEPVFAQNKLNRGFPPLPATRQSRSPLGVAPAGRCPQPPEAAQPLDRSGDRLIGRARLARPRTRFEDTVISSSRPNLCPTATAKSETHGVPNRERAGHPLVARRWRTRIGADVGNDCRHRDERVGIASNSGTQITAMARVLCG